MLPHKHRRRGRDHDLLARHRNQRRRAQCNLGVHYENGTGGLDEDAAGVMGLREGQVTVLIHSGSRGVGNKIGSHLLLASRQLIGIERTALIEVDRHREKSRTTYRELYDAADEAGMLVWQDMPSGGVPKRGQLIGPEAKQDAKFTPEEKAQWR